jgi:hypothetical protein
MGLVRKADLSLNINESILRLQVSLPFLSLTDPDPDPTPFFGERSSLIGVRTKNFNK